MGVSRALLEEVCLLGRLERRTFEFLLLGFDAVSSEEALRSCLCVVG